MLINTLKPALGSRPNKKRLGRGIGSGLGKTSGRGHKGQHARAGGYHKVGFEGGQMPLQRRIPKSGFTSKIALSFEEVRLSELNLLQGAEVDLKALKLANIISRNTKTAKIIASGELKKALRIRGLKATKGARAAIEAAGGSIED